MKGERSKMVKCPGVIGWKANARPPEWTVRENAPLLSGRGGGDGHSWNYLMHYSVRLLLRFKNSIITYH